MIMPEKIVPVFMHPFPFFFIVPKPIPQIEFFQMIEFP